MRLRWVLPIVAIAFALPVSAQQVDQDVRRQIERIGAMYAEHYNKQDAPALAALYTKDGVLVARGVVKSGTQALVEFYERIFQSGTNHLESTVDQASQLGSDTAIGIGEYHVIGQGQSGPIKVDGDWTGVYIREAGTWKIRLLTSVPKPAPPTATK